MTLSYRALGVLTAIRAGAPIDAGKHAAAPRAEGRDAIRKALAELERGGLIARARIQDPATGRWSWDTRLTDPQASPKTENPTPENQAPAANPHVTPKTDSQAPVNQPSAHTPHGYPTENTPSPQVTPTTGLPKSENQASSTCGGTRKDLTLNSSGGVDLSRTHPHTRANNTPTEPATTAIHPQTYQLITAWRITHNPPYRPQTYRALAKHADTLLTNGAPPDLIQAALKLWDTRDNAQPGLLPHLYDDALKTHRAAVTAQHVPSRTAAHEPARSARGDKMRGWLAVGEALQAELDAEAARGELGPGGLKLIEGGRTA